MKEIQEILTDNGFEEREAKIYLHLVKEGDMPALAIARKTQIDRTTIYDILNKLITKGIVSTYSKNKSTQFHALSPNKLLIHFKEKYSSLETIIPELNELNKLNKLNNSVSNKITCELFQGKEGLKSILKELITRGKDYKVIGIRKEYEEVLGYFNDTGILKLNEFKAKEIAIVEKGTKFTKLKHGEYKYLNKNSLGETTTLIYEDVVVFFIWIDSPYAIRIENKAFRKSQEKYFNMLWNISKK